MKCELCNREFTKTYSFWYHLNVTHHYDRKTYFDTYLKTVNNSTCEICGKETLWNSGTKQYNRFCCNKCRNTCKIETLKRNYNVINVFQLESVKSLIKETISLKYNEGRPITNISQSEHWHKKVKDTCNKKYNVDNVLQVDVIKEKISKTMQQKYNCEHPLQNADIHKKYEETCLEKYGCANAAASESVKTKIKETWIEKYNVDHPMKVDYIYRKSKKKIKYNDITFDSKPEVELYKFLTDKQIDFEYQPNVSFTYEYNGTQHKYYPDFRIDNELYELKGAHFFDETGKMINPYDRSKDDLYEAKHQCMISNNINIIIV